MKHICRQCNGTGVVKAKKHNLAQCPFCGSYVEFHSGWKHNDRENDKRQSREPKVHCSGCGIHFSSGIFDRNITDAGAAEMVYKTWNRRII